MRFCHNLEVHAGGILFCMVFHELYTNLGIKDEQMVRSNMIQNVTVFYLIVSDITFFLKSLGAISYTLTWPLRSIVIVKGGLISEGTIWFPLQKSERNHYPQLNF